MGAATAMERKAGLRVGEAKLLDRPDIADAGKRGQLIGRHRGHDAGSVEHRGGEVNTRCPPQRSAGVALYQRVRACRGALRSRRRLEHASNGSQLTVLHWCFRAPQFIPLEQRQQWMVDRMMRPEWPQRLLRDRIY